MTSKKSNGKANADLASIVDMANDIATYCELRTMLLNLELRAQAGDEKAAQILEIVKHFNKLVELARKQAHYG